MLLRTSHHLARSLPSGGGRRFLGTRKTARRAQIASARQVQRQGKRDSGNNAVQEKIDLGEQILSESSMQWGFFAVLGVAPLVAFGVLVSSNPHLKQQFDELIATARGQQLDRGNEDKKDEGH